MWTITHTNGTLTNAFTFQCNLCALPHPNRHHLSLAFQVPRQTTGASSPQSWRVILSLGSPNVSLFLVMLSFVFIFQCVPMSSSPTMAIGWPQGNVNMPTPRPVPRAPAFGLGMASSSSTWGEGAGGSNSSSLQLSSTWHGWWIYWGPAVFGHFCCCKTEGTWQTQT